MIRQHGYAVAVDRSCESGAALRIFDRPVVLIDEDHLLVEEATGLVEDLREIA